MKYNIYKPSDSLKNIIKQYFIITSIYDVERLLFLPNGGNFLIFNRNNQCQAKLCTDKTYTIPNGFSIGLKRNKAKKIVFDDSSTTEQFSFPFILVELTPVGFYKLFHQDASTLTDEYLAIDEAIIQTYFDKLYTHSTIKDEIQYLNDSFEKMDANNKNSRLLVEDIIDSIVHKHHFEVTVEELTKEFNCSRRTMERQFKKMIGLTPKNFIYTLKFCKTFLEYVRDMKPLKTIEYLYSDSAHFNVVFQNITGHAPSELINAVNKGETQIYQMSHNE
jgi:AraC-like DNA-binding protein